MTSVIGLAPTEPRGEALAGLFLAAYLGLLVPVVGLGMATRMLSCKVALLGFTAILLVVGCWLLRLASDTREVA